MKKLILLLTVIFLTTTALQAQDSKFYLGIGVGYATAGGDIADDGDIKGGINLKFLDMGYRFNETWGVTAGLASSGHGFDGYDADELTVGVAHFAIGPMYTTPLGNTSWDIKPQLAVSYAAKESGDFASDADFTGSAFILGNSFVFGDGGKGFAWSIDVDYRMGKIKEVDYGDGDTIDIDEDNTLNNLKIGVGLRYNF